MNLFYWIEENKLKWTAATIVAGVLLHVFGNDFWSSFGCGTWITTGLLFAVESFKKQKVSKTKI
ncbi:hypothetical protein GWC95_17270 [Sediminibacterium roseum]|uniref:Uncharacterized protein n=1 Tax=Sediminibacterium roseum TaxID=1978412 RepID=A0ABW9ZWZ7_9BACT|nr:hypothetical protein [Sediminibacterium roseum]NCI51678.1 hypothetical protein [Sediminibacterium roseum]